MPWRHDQQNPNQARHLHEATRSWHESEWALNILRTQTATRIQPATDKEILEWYRKLKTKR